MLKRIREYGVDGDGLVSRVHEQVSSYVHVHRTTPILHLLG
jgi:hypothetical protein